MRRTTADPYSETMSAAADGHTDGAAEATRDDGAAPEGYEVTGEVGRGGMGRVVRARDLHLGRDVAVKELTATGPGARARFEREARITARLQHPSIVPIHQLAATADGHPYYVMKLVSGRTLREAIAAAPSYAARIALLPSVIAVAQAVAYAHSQHIIHRDLKASNVILGDFGETVVIDWGLAKEISEPEPELDEDHPAAGPYRAAATAALTQAGAVVGTPGYMAPEQVRGEQVGPPADVFALGTILYHVLAGVPPYEGRSVEEIFAAVLAGRVVPLAERMPQIPADLAAIVTKAMAEQPQHRYPTARELADDLVRFQTGHLVGAHAYSTWQLARRWLRRHRAVVSVAALALAAVAAVGVVAFERVVAARGRAEVARRAADDNRQAAEGLAGFMLHDLHARLLAIGRLDVLEAVNARAEEYFRAHRDPSSVAQETRYVEALLDDGDIQRQMGALPRAIEAYRAAAEVAEADRTNDPQLRDFVRRAHQQLGAALSQQGDSDGAQRELETAVARAEALVAAQPDQLVWRQNLSNAELELGDQDQSRSQLSAALRAYERAEQLARAVADAAPDDDALQYNLVLAAVDVADVRVSLGDRAAAAHGYADALAIATRLAARSPDDVRWQVALASAHAGALRAAQAEHRGADALEHARAALAIAERLAQGDPADAMRQGALVEAAGDLGDAQSDVKDVDGALATYRRALTLAEANTRRWPNAITRRALALAHLRVSDALETQGHHVEALAEGRAGLELEQALATDPSAGRARKELAYGHELVARALRGQGDLAGALAEEEAGLGALRDLSAREPADWHLQWRMADALHRAAALHDQLHDGKALDDLREALAIVEALAKVHGDDRGLRARVANAHHAIGHLLLDQRDGAGAGAELREEIAELEALATADSDDDDGRQTLERAYEDLAASSRLTGDRDGERHAAQQALAIAERRLAAVPGDAERRAQVERLRPAAR